MEHHDGPGAAALGAVAALATSLALSPLRTTIGMANVAMVLTLVVVVAAAVAGRRTGVVTAVVAALGFNALHTRPYLTLRIDRPRDVLTFGLMLAVGLAVGALAHVAAGRARRAERNRTGIRHLHELADLASRGVSAEVLADRSQRYLVEQLGLRACRFVRSGATAPPDLDHRGTIDGPLRHRPGGFELPPAGVSLPVTAPDGHVVGRFVLEPSPGRGVSLADRELAVLVADVVAPSLAARERNG